MREFLRGCRRKAGCVTLVMACVAAAGWVRSLYVLDQVCVSRENQSPIYLLQSVNGSIRWLYDEERGAEIYLWMARPRDSSPKFFADDPEWEWKFRWLGFGACKPSRLESLWCIPYWSVAVSLTLLSSFLILWQRKPSATTSGVVDGV